MELFFDIQPGWLRPTRHLTTRGIARIFHTVGLAIHWAGIHDAAAAHGNVDPIRLGSSAQLSNGEIFPSLTRQTPACTTYTAAASSKQPEAALDPRLDPA